MNMELRTKVSDVFFSVPVRIKIAGIMVLPVLVLGFALNYWIRTGLSDWLSYLLTDDRVSLAMQSGSRSVVMVTILAAVISVLLTFVLMLILTRPLLELRQVALDVAEGNLSSRARIWTQDEIGEVADAVNTMIDRLVASQQNLRRTNRRLEAINRVILAVGRELELQEVLDAALTTTLDVMRLDTGWILLRDSPDPDDAVFYLASQVGLDANLKQELQNSSSNLCSCQRDLLSRNLGSKATFQLCNRFGNGEDNGLPRNHITIPLVVREQQLGIMNFVCPEEHSPGVEALDLLTTIGAHLSEIAANAQLHASLVEKEVVRQALLKALVRAQEDERARLALELHDGAGQSLTSLLVRLKVLEKQAASEKLKSNVSDLCGAVSETIEQVREVSYRLRPSALAEFGLEVALKTLVQDMAEAAKLTTECKLELEGRRLPFETESTLYRIAQESITNIVRHAHASHIFVELISLPYAVCLRIDDDGVGFDPEAIVNSGDTRRLGLIGMQERAEMLDGSLEVHSGSGAGTSVRVRIPLQMGETS